MVGAGAWISSRLEAYDYELPERLIAQHPAEPRDGSRLLVLDRAKGSWEHRKFLELPDLLDSRDLCVANNTRVLKARLLGRRVAAVAPEARGGKSAAPAVGGPIGGKVEFVLLEEREPRVWEGLFHASARYVPGLCFEIPTPDGKGLRGELVRGSADSPAGTVVARFDRDPLESGAGELPLPHYIRRAAVRPHHPILPEASPRIETSQTLDDESYQTIYAKKPGSAAAPTAGLHFTERVREGLVARGVGWAELTLHVGLGTFRPVKEAEIERHRMHEERYEIPADVAETITRAKQREGLRIVAIGTTSARTLESAWDGEALRPGPGRTSIFIYPGGRSFRVVDRLLTNFHLPKSSLLMMVCALAGRDLVLAAYEDAIREGYRFYSYGDAMLIV